MKILIKNGYIVDGSGSKGFNGMILINEEVIEKIAISIDCDPDIIIDAKKCVVTPGFIDTHSHSDLQILVNPYNEAKIRQGITTEILGQDGISMAPLPSEYIMDWRKNLAGLDGDSNNINWNYETTEGYLNLLKKTGVSQNQSYLVPHGNIRMEAMGLDNRLPRDIELQKMKDILRRELKTGAIGLSTGLIYIPCAYADTNELIELCKIVKESNGVFVVHQRSEADSIVSSTKEIIEIGKKSGVKIHFSHFKVCGKKNWDKIGEVLSLIENAKNEGIEISFDQYPYVAGSTMLGVVLPPWVHDGGTNKLIERLRDSKIREKIKNDIEIGIPGWDNFIDFAGFEGIFITSVTTSQNEDLIGKNIVEISRIKSKDPLDAIFDLLIEEENAVGMVDFYGKEEHIVRFLNHPFQNVCTDGLLGGKPHPRAYGSFPRVISKYVREEKELSLENAINKMTYKPAKVFGFLDRGYLKEGNFADIVIF